MSLNKRLPFNGEAIGVIPARLAATRFPNKPLALIRGIPMICWTVKRACQVPALREVIVAAEDEQIVEAVTRQGGRAVLVQGVFRTGSDRVAAAIRNHAAPVVVNIQVDEPLLEPDTITRALTLLEERSEFDVTTAVRRIYDPQEYLDPNCVKVVLDRSGRCLYFSRAPIPAQRKPEAQSSLPRSIPFYRHIGLYCYRREALQRFAELPESNLERSEGLEQLRLLEHGGIYGAVETTEAYPGVDTPEDLLAAERYLNEKGIQYT